MRTATARDLESNHQDDEEGLTPDLQLAAPKIEPPDARSYDPTQGSKIGSDPFDDPTQGRKVGSDPYDDPTRAG